MKKLKTLQELKEDILMIDISKIPVSEKDQKEIQEEIEFMLTFLQEDYDYTKDWDVDEEWVRTRATILPHIIKVFSKEEFHFWSYILYWMDEKEYEQRISDLEICEDQDWVLPKEYFEKMLVSKYMPEYRKDVVQRLMQKHAA